VIWRVELPMHPKSLNRLLRDNRWVRKNYRTDVAIMLLANAPSKTRIEGPVRVHYTEYYARQPKDLTNLAGAFKVIEDQIVRLGVLEDDNPKTVVDIKYAQHKVAKVSMQRVVIEIEQVNQQEQK